VPLPNSAQPGPELKSDQARPSGSSLYVQAELDLIKKNPAQSGLGKRCVLEKTLLCFTPLFSPIYILISNQTSLFVISKNFKYLWVFLNLFIDPS